MAHTYPPEDPNSAASTFAPDQPRRGVAADDVEQKGQLADGQETASGATAADAKAEREPVSTGPDRAPHEDPLHEVIPDLADDDEEAAKQSGGVPRQAAAREPREGEKRASAPVGDDKASGGKQTGGKASGGKADSSKS